MKKSFTLIELIVVIAIIAILAAIIAPNAFKTIEKARVAKTITDMKTIKSALQAYYADTGKFPDPFYLEQPGYGHQNENDATCSNSYNFDSPPLMVNEDAAGNPVFGWDGPYLERVLKSPITHEWVSAGFAYPGVYWIGGTKCYRTSFDLDGDGALDITNAVSVQLGGLTEKDALAIDNIFDGDAKIGFYGVNNVYYMGAAIDYYAIYYYVGS